MLKEDLKNLVWWNLRIGWIMVGQWEETSQFPRRLHWVTSCCNTHTPLTAMGTGGFKVTSEDVGWCTVRDNK